MFSMETRKTLKEVLSEHFKGSTRLAVFLVMTAGYAAMLRYAILPYLASVHIVPVDILNAHMGPFPGGYLRTLATLTCFRLIVGMLK